MSKHNNVLMNKWSMLAMNIGSMIGAGIVTLVGIAMGYTGTSVWFAYGIALLLGFLYNLPFCFVTSAIKLVGGPYTLVNTILGKKIGGIYIVCFLLYLPSIALYCVSLNTYIQSLFDGVPNWLTPVVTLIFFFIIQLRGIKSLASAQNIMTILLIIGLMTFAIIGFSKVEWSAVSPSSPNFMLDGFHGVMKAALLLVFSTYGHYYIAFMSRMCENPKQDIPFSIIGCVIVLVIVYISVSIVAAGVLPLEIVANQPLTHVAKTILPAPLFVFFIVAGPLMALFTTTNGIMIQYAEPLYTAAQNNYFPQRFAVTNRYGQPWVAYTLVFLCAFIPIVLGWKISTIAHLLLLVDIGLSVLMMISIWKVPKRYPKAWRNRYFLRKVPDWGFYTCCIMAFFVQAIIIYNSITSIEPYIVVATLITFVIAVFYTLHRLKTVEVKMPDIGVEE